MSNGDDSSDYDNDSTIDADYDPRKDQNDDDMDMDEEEPEPHEVRQLAVGGGPPVGDQQLEIEGNPPVVSDDVHPSARFHKRTGKVLTRKRSCDPNSWKCNIRKKLMQSGKRYINSRGNVQEARSVKTKKDCSKCKFKCSLNISEKDRSDIFKEFWSINDNEKMNFFAKTTTQETKKRPRGGAPRRRHRSLTYCLPVNDQNVRVCKMFYLTTLDINHKRVRTYHNSKHAMGGTPEHLKWGKSANNVVPQEIKDGIRVHINSIPRVESHYCRATTNKEYVAPGLSISLLYEKYVEKCNETGRTPGKNPPLQADIQL